MELLNEFRCSNCLKLPQKGTFVQSIKCPHRFCKECIDGLRKLECPDHTCRQPVKSRSDFVADKLFNSLYDARRSMLFAVPTAPILHVDAAVQTGILLYFNRVFSQWNDFLITFLHRFKVNPKRKHYDLISAIISEPEQEPLPHQRQNIKRRNRER